jgi:molybdopterin-guanine dinucleotide biosynthesis protein B
MLAKRVLGIAGWSGSGKTTLLVRLIPLLVQRGLRVTTIKHAHHDFDIDTPGKDSYEHRKAGASEVLISSARRWVQMHEVENGCEAGLAELLHRASPCDLVLVEGYKRDHLPKIEVFRPRLGKPPLYLHDPRILAVATDEPLAGVHPALIDLNDLPAVADAVLALAEASDRVVQELARAAAAGTPSPG